MYFTPRSALEINCICHTRVGIQHRSRDPNYHTIHFCCSIGSHRCLGKSLFLHHTLRLLRPAALSSHRCLSYRRNYHRSCHQSCHQSYLLSCLLSCFPRCMYRRPIGNPFRSKHLLSRSIHTHCSSIRYHKIQYRNRKNQARRGWDVSVLSMSSVG